MPRNPGTSCLDSTNKCPCITNLPSTSICSSRIDSDASPETHNNVSFFPTPFPSPACRACPPSLPRLSAVPRRQGS
ncbi:hypothetical protein M431DRAFT_251979 [Trichoderma harzianum CBS 226.95]|uniref:Uncharacterized protein n=1 Tax=Trichoderma harzianum CBS 226.95 TaxID=983964 RepID=A0A2T3ZZZ8_TRIHA|nr:hypothetical protein M431DRAFT_251979 [Trichoderma harzianum CBS 226.95]PTB50386.1 hypothetical protein M431DRAFT_251979 [Trichoderma harzianum CBS 226.95]